MFLSRSAVTKVSSWSLLSPYGFLCHKIRPLSSSSSGLYRLLTEDERKILSEQRKLTEASQEVASKVGCTSLDSVLSSQSSSFLEKLRLEATFSVVIAGEFNAGKSTLINALLGNKFLESGALPTTDSITIVTSSRVNNWDENSQSTELVASKNDLSASLLGVVVHSVNDLPLLEDLTLIDTPGTNSAWMDHTERTLKFLPAADLILFVSTADRPFSDSERNLLQSIQAYHKNIVIVINKMDVLDISGGDHGAVQKNDVIDFVTDKVSKLLGARPVVIPVSSRDALSSKLTQSSSSLLSANRSEVWYRSNFAALETFLKDTLTTKAKIKSKLSNPLGVTEGMMAQCLDVLKEQQEELKVDVATLNIFRSQFEGWKKEFATDLNLSLNTMADIVREEGHRCDILLNRMNLYTFHYWTLYDTNRLEEEWLETKREVSIHRQYDKSLKADLMDHVFETAESVATRGRAQSRAVIEYLGMRPAVRNNQSLGSVTAVSRFEDTKKNLTERLSNAVNDIINTGVDKSIEREHLDKDQLFRSLKKSALLSLSLQISALGSGGLLALQMIDPTVGCIILVPLSFGGGASYAMSKARIRQWYKELWSRRAHHLNKVLQAITDKEVDRVNRRILDGVAPYTRFVETEQERIGDLQEQCERIAIASRNLRNRINKLR